MPCSVRHVYRKPVLGGVLFFLFSLAWSATANSQAQQATGAKYNPAFFYFIDGEPIGGRQFTLGDPDNWNTAVDNLSGRSATGKVTVSPDKFKRKGDAIKAVWSRSKSLGQLALYGPPIDLSAVKDMAALVFDMKLERKPKGEVTLAMDCGWPCRGQLSIRSILRDTPTDEWFAFPVPLNCFKGDKFDLSKINGVFLISTQDRLELSIANIRVERLGKGEKGCVSE